MSSLPTVTPNGANACQAVPPARLAVEEKYDVWRTIAYKEGLMSASSDAPTWSTERSRDLPNVIAALNPPTLILDGEVRNESVEVPAPHRRP